MGGSRACAALSFSVVAAFDRFINGSLDCARAPGLLVELAASFDQDAAAAARREEAREARRLARAGAIRAETLPLRRRDRDNADAVAAANEDAARAVSRDLRDLDAARDAARSDARERRGDVRGRAASKRSRRRALSGERGAPDSTRLT